MFKAGYQYRFVTWGPSLLQSQFAGQDNLRVAYYVDAKFRAMHMLQEFNLNATVAFVALTVVYYLVSTYKWNGLDRYPGPLLAKFTKLWHRLSVQSNRHQHQLLSLHRRCGNVIRIGPQTLSISHPDYIARVYGVSVTFLKVSRVRNGVRPAEIIRATCMMSLRRALGESEWTHPSPSETRKFIR